MLQKPHVAVHQILMTYNCFCTTNNNSTTTSKTITQCQRSSILNNDNDDFSLDKTIDVFYSNIMPCYLLDYKSIKQFNCCNADSLSFLQLNIASFGKHFDELSELISTLPFAPTLICLNKIRLMLKNLNIESYKLMYQLSPNVVGGVGLYMAETCTFEITMTINFIYLVARNCG